MSTTEPLAAPRPATKDPTWRYSVGMLGLSIPINMIRGSMLLFYVDILGLDVRAYGIVMTFYALLDAIDNPVLGYLSDRTRTRFGRRRPWLVIGSTILVAAFVGFFFAPDNLSGLGLVAWFTVFALLCEAADSMVSANYGALLPEMFPEEKGRASANSLRQGFQLVAMVLALAVTPLLTTSVFGTETSVVGFRVTAAIYAVIAFAVLLFMALSVRENPRYTDEIKPSFVGSITDVLKTKLFWQIGIASACYLLPLALVLSGVQLYVKYSLGLPVASALYVQGVVILLAALGLWLWTKVVRAKGAPFVWRWSFVVLALGFVPLYFATSLLTAILAGAVIAAGWSGLLATNDLIQARLLDEDARRHGVHREGIYLSAFGFFGRLTGAVNGAALASLGTVFGYYSGSSPGNHPGDAFRLYLSVYPFLIAAAGVVLTRFIRIPAAGAHAIPGGFPDGEATS